MPPPLGARGIMFSGCPSIHPSVRPKPEITFVQPVHGSVGPSDQLWPFGGMSVRLSVRPSVRRGFRAFARECMEEMVWNFACWCILGTFRTDQIMVMVCWFSFLWRHFDLVKWVKFGVSGHFSENAWWELPEILHADVSWPPSGLVNSHGLLIFLILAFFYLVNGSNLGFPGISWRTLGENDPKFCMLMYLEHFQNWLDYDCSLLIFIILALFWLSEMGQIWGFRAFPGERMEGMAWNFGSCCIMVMFRIDKIMVTVCWFF